MRQTLGFERNAFKLHNLKAQGNANLQLQLKWVRHESISDWCALSWLAADTSEAVEYPSASVAVRTLSVIGLSSLWEAIVLPNLGWFELSAQDLLCSQYPPSHSPALCWKETEWLGADERRRLEDTKPQGEQHLPGKRQGGILCAASPAAKEDCFWLLQTGAQVRYVCSVGSTSQTGEMAQPVRWLPGKQEDFSSHPTT